MDTIITSGQVSLPELHHDTFQNQLVCCRGILVREITLDFRVKMSWERRMGERVIR